MPQMKYEKHNARQYEQILRAARQLFVEKGIERVSFSAVADSCGIARATLYKYFPDKESLLWAIHRQALRTFGNALLARAEARPLTALERFSVYFEELARRFELDPDFLLFFDLFEKILSGGNGAAWQRCLRADVPAGRFRLRRHCTIFMREF